MLNHSATMSTCVLKALPGKLDIKRNSPSILYLYHQRQNHTGQCKRTGGCYNELVVAFFSTGGGVKGKKIYTC